MKLSFTVANTSLMERRREPANQSTVDMPLGDG